MKNIWHIKTISEVLKITNSTEKGLSESEALHCFKKYGPNQLPESKTETLLVIFLNQFKSPLIYLLFLAGVIVFLIDEPIDAFIIFAVLIFNAIVGTIQEGKAKNALLALNKFVTTKATVLREGKELIIPDTEVVFGDIIILNEGEKIPADARIIISNNLKIDEATMTGESNPVSKTPEVLKSESLDIGDQKNMVFKGTNIVFGNGRAVVVETGIETVIGKIAKQISGIKTEIPLQANIRELSNFIIIAVMGISTFLFSLGVISGKSGKEMFMIVVSLAVSIIPEGLPIVITLILATGVWRMSKRNALVKKLQAVESLGQAEIIAVDKTGTITKNELIVQKIFINNKIFSVEGVGYEPEGKIFLNEKEVKIKNDPDLFLAAKMAAYCSGAKVMFSPEEKIWRIAGDPTEAAMLVFSQKAGILKDKIEKKEPVILETPFDYKLKYRAVFYGNEKEKTLAISGAPENILNLCSRIWRDGKKHNLGIKEKKEIEKILNNLSGQGLRIIAFAEKNNLSTDSLNKKVENLDFIGFYAMKDSLRPEVGEAMKKAISAGIKVIMITGDYKTTAVAIAKEAGIYQDGDNVLVGEDIDKMTDQELSQNIIKTTVFARVNPNHKLIIVNAFRAQGQIIAMTGDGVNDAPSLVAADLGVAMGNIGTEVAKEAADIILLDDNFGSIISAVEEGRSIYKNIKKVILYFFSTSFGEVLLIVGALFLGYPLPLIAAQIIWLNLVTDGFLDVALAMEPKELGLLKDSFQKPKKYLVDGLMLKRIFLMALPMAIGTLFLFKDFYKIDIIKAQTISLTLMAAFQWFNAWNCRSEEKSIFKMNLFSNKFLIGATVIVVALQIFAVYCPFMQKILRTTALNSSDWLVIIFIALSIIIIEELRKLFFRKTKNKKNL